MKMKTIEEAAQIAEDEYYNEIIPESDAVLYGDFISGFKAGVEFAQRWIPIEEELPEIGIDVLANDKDYGLKLYLELDKIDIHEIEYTCNKWRQIELK